MRNTQLVFWAKEDAILITQVFAYEHLSTPTLPGTH